MKKNDQDNTLFNLDIAQNKNLEKDNIKTTNINILLNRVRQDKKKTIKKRFAFVIFLLASIFLISYFIIG